MLMTKTGLLALSLFLAASLEPTASHAAEVSPTTPFRIVAMEGALAPGVLGQRFGTFHDPLINDSGHVVFASGLTISGPNTGVGIFGDFGDGPSYIAHGAQSPRDLPFEAVGRHQLNNAGEVAFVGQVAFQSSNIYRWSPTGLTLLAQPGQVAPGAMAPMYLHSTTSLSINDAGDVAFVDFNGSFLPPEPAIFRRTDDQWQQVIRVNAAAPDGNGQLQRFHSIPLLNEQGQVAFTGLYANATPGTTGAVLVADRDGQPRIIARDGQVLDDAMTTLTFMEFATPVINNRGDVAFTGAGRGIDGRITSILFLGNADHLSQVVRAQIPAPDGDLYSSFYDVALNDSGQLAYLAVTRDAAGEIQPGLYLGNSAAQRKVLRVGELAPDGNGLVSEIRTPLINSAGSVAFLALFNETASGEFDDTAILYASSDGDVRKVIREGDPFAGSTVARLTFASNYDYTRNPGTTQFNDRGQIAFWFRLADGRDGIAVWTVPEPTGVTALAAGALLLVSRRHRRPGR
jgi:hypothetical protein